MADIEFHLQEGSIALAKLLKATGLCESGGSAKYAIRDSQVSVDGKIETRKSCKIIKNQLVEFLGNKVRIV